MDRGGEKADLEGRRCPPRIRPQNWKGPWPPKTPPRGFIRPEIFFGLGAAAADVIFLIMIPEELGCDSLDGCGDDDDAHPPFDPNYQKPEVPLPNEDPCGCG